MKIESSLNGNMLNETNFDSPTDQQKDIETVASMLSEDEICSRHNVTAFELRKIIDAK